MGSNNTKLFGYFKSTSTKCKICKNGLICFLCYKKEHYEFSHENNITPLSERTLHILWGGL